MRCIRVTELTFLYQLLYDKETDVLLHPPVAAHTWLVPVPAEPAAVLVVLVAAAVTPEPSVGTAVVVQLWSAPSLTYPYPPGHPGGVPLLKQRERDET